MNLEDSIDALLAEVDTTCASVENPKSPQRQSMQSAPTIAAKPASSPVPAEITTSPEANGTPDSDNSPTPVDDAQGSEVHDEAMDAIQRVEEKAQELLEDSIDQLLRDAAVSDSADQTMHAETVDDPSSQIDAIEPVYAQPPMAQELTDAIDEIETQLDALQGPDSTASPSSAPVRPQSESDATDLDADSQEVPAPPDADASEPPEVPEDIMDQIADELTGGASVAETANSADTQAKPEAEPALADAGTDIQTGLDTTETEESTAQSADFDAQAAGELTDSPAPDTPASSDAMGDVADEVLSGALSPETPSPDRDAGAPSEEDILSTLADLDDSLAGAGMELMGDFETPEGELIRSESLSDGDDASALLDQLGLDDLSLQAPLPVENRPASPAVSQGAADNANAMDAAERSPAPTAQQSPPTPASAKPTVPAGGSEAFDPVSMLSETDGAVESIWQSGHRVLLMRARQARELIQTHAGPIAARVVLAINKPVKDRPAQIRDSIGYLALWTLLMASILWVYLVFIRVSPTPKPTQAPSRMIE